MAFHAAFILFVVLGAAAVVRWPRLAWLHVPCAVWGGGIELLGWVCPLTPLENALRVRAGLAGYPGGFIENYVIPVVYPDELTRTTQLALGFATLAINVLAYAWLWERRARSRTRASPRPSR